MTAATTFFPQVQQAEKSALNSAYQAEQRLQHDVTDWYQHRQARSSNNNHPHGKWVEGEQKLKQQLKILAQRQANQQDIGVPVATRWLGDDIPAWPEQGKEDEWKRAVEKRYDEMRQEEARWIEMAKQTVQH